MSYKINITTTAADDLRGIYEYIAWQLLEPQIAKKQYLRIKKEILSLDEMPERFALYADEPWHSRGVRTLAAGNFLVFYIVDKADCKVTVLRIMYGGRDIEAQLTGD